MVSEPMWRQRSPPPRWERLPPGCWVPSCDSPAEQTGRSVKKGFLTLSFLGSMSADLVLVLQRPLAALTWALRPGSLGVGP